MPDRGSGRPTLQGQLAGPPLAASEWRRSGTAAAHGAAVLAFTYAAVSLYWAAGGTALLSTVGGGLENVGRHGGLTALALGLAAPALKLAGGILALALIRPWGRLIPRAWLLACATAAGAVVTGYGAIQVAVGSLVLAGAVHPAGVVDWTALRWHVLVWDMWFLIWGVLLVIATVAAWRQRRRPGQAAALARPDGHAGLAPASQAGGPAAQGTGASRSRTGPSASVVPPGAGHGSGGWRTAAQATLHCLTGCAIGEVLGMAIGAAAGLASLPTVILSVVLAFTFGYGLTMRGVLRAGLGPQSALRAALAADTASIAVMELADNAVIVAVPGAMDAGLTTALFWGSLAVSLVAAFLVTTPLNRWLIDHGKGHAVLHSHHGRK